MNNMPNPRYLSIDMPNQPPSNVEVLEVFNINQVPRVFNLRIRRGMWAPNETIAAALKKAYEIPDGWMWTANTMAGDLTVSFDSPNPACPRANEVKSDNFGSSPRPANLSEVPPERWVDGGIRRGKGPRKSA